MAFDSYSALQAEIAGSSSSWSHRADVAAKVPGFITLAEKRFGRVLKAREYETEDALVGVQGSRYVSLPTGFLKPLALWLSEYEPRRLIRMILPEQLEPSTDNSLPLYWAVDGANIAFDCPAESAFDLDFRYIKAFALSDSNTTNYVLEEYPDLYLFGALVELATYVKSTKDMQVFEGRYQAALRDAMDAENTSREVELMTELPDLLRGQSADINRGW